VFCSKKRNRRVIPMLPCRNDGGPESFRGSAAF
jgi:hypothetical protein